MTKIEEVARTISVAFNLPTKGTREDYLHCVSSGLTAARERGDYQAAMTLAGLLTLVDEGIAFAEKSTPHFFNPAWGRTAREPGDNRIDAALAERTP